MSELISRATNYIIAVRGKAPTHRNQLHPLGCSNNSWPVQEWIRAEKISNGHSSTSSTLSSRATYYIIGMLGKHLPTETSYTQRGAAIPHLARPEMDPWSQKNSKDHTITSSELSSKGASYIRAVPSADHGPNGHR